MKTKLCLSSGKLCEWMDTRCLFCLLGSDCFDCGPRVSGPSSSSWRSGLAWGFVVTRLWRLTNSWDHPRKEKSSYGPDSLRS